MDEDRAHAILKGVQDLRRDASGKGKEPINLKDSSNDHNEGDFNRFSYSSSEMTPPVASSTSTIRTEQPSSRMKTVRDARGSGSSNSVQTTATPQVRRSSPPSSTSSQAGSRPKKPIGVNSLIVSPRQKGNPLLQYIRNVPWEYGEINADYVTGATSCVLFLSLKYHRLHPEYIYTRIKKLGRDFELRIILVVVDVENHAESMRELSKTCMYNDVTTIACWSPQEAANYLSQLKLMETASPTLIQGIAKEDYNSQLIEVMGKIRGVNKNDAVSLVTNYGSLKNAVLDGGENIEMIPGWGETKAKRFKAAVSEPFVFNKTYDITEDTYKKTSD
jgi:DNA excision repair protein ERCC-1